MQSDAKSAFCNYPHAASQPKSGFEFGGVENKLSCTILSKIAVVVSEGHLKMGWRGGAILISGPQRPNRDKMSVS